jgi:hypothetical protein
MDTMLRMLRISKGATSSNLNFKGWFPGLLEPPFSNPTENPMQPEILAKAPRCGAKTRSGYPCQSPAVRGRKRCRMHGGTNQGAPKGNKNAWKHGNRSAEAEEQLKAITASNRDLRLVKKLNQGSRLTTSEHDHLFNLYLDRVGGNSHSTVEIGASDRNAKACRQSAASAED